ncbi:MAG: hypothetical protein KDA71_07430, partial [Planctomycetales bacterium]|nr:hypothetical protein [Planctomycetales bacterium]
EKPLTTPGRMLLVDRDGNMIVRDETEDIVEYRQLLLRETDPPEPEEMMGQDPMDPMDVPAGAKP